MKIDDVTLLSVDGILIQFTDEDDKGFRAATEAVLLLS